jgi:hypothetical protein
MEGKSMGIREKLPLINSDKKSAQIIGYSYMHSSLLLAIVESKKERRRKT